MLGLVATATSLGATPVNAKKPVADANLTSTSSGELLEVGPTKIRVLEDGSRTDNRIGSIASMLPPGVPGPPQHVHLMHDETFLIIRGVLRFTLGSNFREAKAGDYVVVPVGAPHTFVNASDAPVEFFTTFTPAYYVNYFRELASLSASGGLNPKANLALMLRYATVPG